MFRLINPLVFNSNKVFRRNIHICKKLRKVEYTENEEWLFHQDNFIKIGITKNAVKQLSEIVYLDFNYDKNDKLNKGDDILSIESVKATDTISVPFDCILLENNIILSDNLDNLNENPEDYNENFLVKIKKI